MSSVIYQNGISKAFEGDLDWETANLDVRLLMTDTSADTDVDADTVDDITTLDECDATGYAHEDVTTPAITVDDTDNEVVFSSDNWVWPGLSGDATRDYKGALLVLYVDGGAGDIPLIFVDFTADVPKEATQVTAPVPDEGWFNIGQPAA